MRLKLTITALILLSTLAQAELPAHVVQVTGTSEVKVVPDRAVLSLGVTKQSPSARLAKQTADTASRKILATLLENGIDEKDIQTTWLSLQPQYNYRDGMKLSYFSAEQTLTVTVRDLARLDDLLESLMKTGVNQIDSIRYETSELRKYRDQAREQAIKAAREKAETLAKALGQGIGKAYSIQEVAQYNQSPWNLMSNSSVAETRAAANSGPTLAAGEQTISASVIVTFDLN